MTQPPPPYQQPSPGPYGQQPYQGHAPGHQYPHQGGAAGYQQPYQGPHAYQQPYQGQPQGHQQYAPPQGYEQPYQGHPQGHQQSQGAAQTYPAPPRTPQPHGMVLACRICGSAPAAQVTFRGVVGAVIMHTIWTANGPFCRDCGLHTFRKQTTKTLAGGWCSVGALVLTPIFLLLNVIARGKVANLPAPQRYMAAPSPAPLDPGPSVFQRPGAYVYPVIFFVFWMLIIIGNLSQ